MGYRKYFTDTVTVYHKVVDPVTREDVYTPVVVPGVMARTRVDVSTDSGGIVHRTSGLTVTLLPESDPVESISEGDILVVGCGEALSDTYTMKNLRQQHPEMCRIQSIIDNRSKPYLKHRKVICA